MRLINNIIGSVREVNRKYAKPEIETTLFVKICLLTLRLYLLGMVGLMVFALINQARSGATPAQTTPALNPTNEPANRADAAARAEVAAPMPSTESRSSQP